MNSASDPCLAAYPSPPEMKPLRPRFSEASFRRASLIKRKLPPSAPAYAAHEDSIWQSSNGIADGEKDSPAIRISLHSSHPSDDMPDIYHTLTTTDSDSEEKSQRRPRLRGRAHTLPAKKFNLVRVPPPIVDDILLAEIRPAALSCRSVSFPGPAIARAVLEASEPISISRSEVVVDRERETVAADEGENETENRPDVASELRKLKRPDSLRKSAMGFMQKTSALGRRSVAAISAPVTYAGRKFSAVSMVSTNASTFTLSAFPRPPEVAPPVPTLPPLQAFNTHNTSEVASATPSLPPPDAPQSELRSLNSYIQHVDPPSPPPNESRPLAVLGSPEPETRASPPPSESKVESTTDAKGKVPAMPVVTDGTVPREPHFDFGDPPEYDEFDEDRLPTRRQLETAAELPVISESGVRVSFGSVFEQQKTIVCFIRHFWCPLCQDYMFSISRNVSAEVLQSAGVELVIISNGSYEMIKSYRQIFRSPFAVFTDPTHKVYNALGMTLKTLKPGPKGNYVRHGLMSGLGMVVVNAVKVGMPVWKEGGKISQLGGEFVLGPGMTCTWVHRMKYTRNHIPILQVVREAGVDMYSPLHHALSTTGSTFLGMSTEHESKWMERRRKALKKLRAKKLSRRGAAQWIDTSSSSSGSSSKRSSGISESIQEMIEGLNDGDEASPGARIEDAADLCLWDPSTEQAINVGLGGYEDAIIEEAEVEAPEANATQKAATQDFEQEAEVDGGSTSTQSESAHSDVMSMADSESQYSDSFVSRDGSSLSSGLNDPESKIGVEMVSPCERGSMSSVGSGFDIVAQHHGVFFEAKAAAIPLAPSLSESSIESI